MVGQMIERVRTCIRPPTLTARHGPTTRLRSPHSVKSITLDNKVEEADVHGGRLP
jgi:hypothetical protein